MTAASFLALTEYNTAEAGFYRYSTKMVRLVATTLTEGNAMAFAESAAPMIGDGVALHYQYAPGYDRSFAITRGTDDDGNCTPTEPNAVGALNVFRWRGGVPTLLACAVAGSVRITTKYNPYEYDEYTFNVQFSDGRVWIDRVMRF